MPWEPPSHEAIKFVEPASRLDSAVQRNNPFLNRIRRSSVGFESDTDDDPKISPGASQPPQQIGIVLRVYRIGRLVLVWYTANAKDLASGDADDYGTYNSVTTEPVQPS